MNVGVPKVEALKDGRRELRDEFGRGVRLLSWNNDLVRFSSPGGGAATKTNRTNNKTSSGYWEVFTKLNILIGNDTIFDKLSDIQSDIKQQHSEFTNLLPCFTDKIDDSQITNFKQKWAMCLNFNTVCRKTH